MNNSVQALAARKSVDEQGARNTEYGQANTAAAKFGKHQQSHDTNDVVCHGHADGAGKSTAYVVVAEAIEEERSCAQQHQYNVVPGQRIDLDVLLAGGIGQKSQYDNAAHKGSETDLNGRSCGQGGVDAVGREYRHKGVDNPLLPTFPNARVRLTVVLTHDSFDVLHSADVHVGSSGLILLRLVRSAVEALYMRLLVVRLFLDVLVHNFVREQPFGFLFLPLRHYIPPCESRGALAVGAADERSIDLPENQAVGTSIPCSEK